MTDHLHPVLDDAAIARMTSLALAHVGDAVYEILVRTHLACGGAAKHCIISAKIVFSRECAALCGQMAARRRSLGDDEVYLLGQNGHVGGLYAPSKHAAVKADGGTPGRGVRHPCQGWYHLRFNCQSLRWAGAGSFAGSAYHASTAGRTVEACRPISLSPK